MCAAARVAVTSRVTSIIISRKTARSTSDWKFDPMQLLPSETSHGPKRGDGTTVSDVHDDVIRLLELLSHDSPRMYTELLAHSNALVRYYLSHGWLSLARNVLDSLPGRFKAWVGGQIESKQEEDQLQSVDPGSSNANSAAEEFSLYVSVIETIRQFLDWSQAMQQRADTTGDTTAHDVLMDTRHTLGKRLLQATEALEIAIREVVLSFDLLSCDETGESLRVLYVPEFFCLLHKVLYESRDFVQGFVVFSVLIYSIV